ncbi:MAG: hypothetical protein GYA55_03550 [SAR324 cluster bacterium]|uniref:Protein kinase domain-containing protein n=1 Tax=SAR324 cluster bacterium TaxID=2024889 RepID=A0A7X9FQ92_9DELT|nr:hypothetical protein [SAR324 cluster bacterium]
MLDNSQIPIRKISGFYIGSLEPDFDLIQDDLANLFEKKPEVARNILDGIQGQNSQALEGRGAILLASLPKYGPLVIKSYHRGGLFHHLVQDRYFRFGKTRGQLEYEMLKQVAELGVNAPKAVAFAYTGSFFYKCWLVMCEIIGKKSLVQLSNENPELCLEMIPLLISQLAILIKNKILHIDLHPGNVVLDREGKLFLLDFDNARIVAWSRNSVRNYYLRRWRRAVIKHNLPDFLSEAVCQGLRKSFEEDDDDKN